MVIVLFGKPGAGKGTQAPRLAAALDVPILATGEALRAALRAGTPMGLAAKAFMDRGDLVADDVILGIIKEVLSQPAYVNGAVLDGVVRTVPQAAGLEKVLSDLGRSLGAVLVFDIPDEEIIERISGRLTCDKCSAPFTGRVPGIACDALPCSSGTGGGVLVRRKDDEPDAVKTRLDAYRKSTEPVLAWYIGNGTRVATINAVGPVDEITERARLALGL
ncbi:MAG: nucleoside monophosphate kinase [Gemmatimonadaceae bacterium]|nr:nucleoside monophosphate kinase [Gemmatimonadaceae bacterium]